MGLRGVARASLVLMILSCLFFSTFQRTASAEANIWASGASAHDLGILQSLTNTANVDCSYMSLKSRYVFKEKVVSGKLVYDEQTYEQEGKTYADVCVAQNEHGLISTGGLWSKQGDKNSVLPIDSSRYTVIPASGGTATIFADIAPLYGYQYSINHNLEYLGSISTKTYGAGQAAKKEKIWKIDTGKLDQFLLYGNVTNGTIARFDQIGFSGNGRYAVVLLSKRGFARLDLVTKELTPFYNVNYNNGVGVFMTISNDGRYAATSKNGSSNFLVHDLLGCQNTFAYGTWQATGVLPNIGCQSKNLFSDVQTLFPTAETVSCLKFAPSGSSLNACARYSVVGGYQSSRVRLDARNYTSSAQGYLAMGDSFSSGEGDGQGGDWYELGTDEQGDINTFAERNLCHLSRRSYPYLMAVELGYLTTNISLPSAEGLFHSVACSGAKMHNITGVLGEKQDSGSGLDFSITDNQYRFNRGFSLESWQPGFEKQIGYISGRQDNLVTNRGTFNPEVITLGIGGNDAGFGEKLKSCLMPGTCEFATNEDKRAELVEELAGEKTRLERVYRTVKNEAPESRVYVHGYPQFVTYPVVTCAANVHLNEAEVRFIHEAINYFNDVIESAAKSAGVYYVDVEGIFESVNMCSGASDERMAFNGATAGNDVEVGVIGDIITGGICYVRTGCIGSESFHPNQKGHVLYKSTILNLTNDLTASMPEESSSLIPIPSDYFGLSARVFVEALNDPQTPDESRAQFIEMVTGAIDYRQPAVDLSGLMPNSTVNFEIHSTPVSLGSTTVGSDGSVTTTLQIPDDVDPGYHELHVYGFDAFGEPIDYYESIILSASETDFDGDGVLNETDSCPTIINSFIDVDEDGIDDACDNELFFPEEEVLPEEQVDETPADNEEQTENEPINEEEKGIPSRETVAGDNDEPAAEVLGASTTTTKAISVTENLQRAGGLLLAYLLGPVILVITSVIFVTTKTTE